MQTNLRRPGASRNRFPRLGVAGFVGVIAGVILINSGLFKEDSWRPGEFVATLVLMAVGFLVIGVALNGRPAGLIIDNRNRVSLSKFQMLLWSVVVISALVTLASCRIRLGLTNPPAIVDPLAIVIPGELLAAMGIAAASFVGAPTVLSLKAMETPTAENMAKADASAQSQGATLDPSGKLQGRTDPAQAQWMDMFRGDEVGASDTPDLSKIQQFAVTILLVSVYIATLVVEFGNSSLFQPAHLKEILKPNVSGVDYFPGALPMLSQWFIGLMAISHASYLAYKAAPHTSTGDDAAGAGSRPQTPRVNALG